MTASLIVSIIAILISGIALYKSWRTQTRQIEIEEARERDRLRESKKARLVARIEKELEAQQARRTIWKYLLRIENKGFGEARGIKVILDEKPVLEHPTILKGQKEITQIGPQSHFDYPLALTMGTPRLSRVQITWSDDSGEPGDYKTSLT